MDTVSVIDMVEDELLHINERYLAEPPRITDPIYALQMRLIAMSMDTQSKRDIELFAQIERQTVAMESIAACLCGSLK